jgi:hypothetical protein
MKKIILLSLASFAIASVVTANPVCQAILNPNTSGGSTTLCSVTADPGDFITSLTLTGADDYTGLQSGTPLVTFTGTLVQSSPVFAITLCNVSTSGGNSVQCPIGVTPASPVNVSGLGITSYTADIIGITNTVSGGTVVGDSVSLALGFTEAPLTTTTPEPATLGLTGMALLGVGFLARRKGKARV